MATLQKFKLLATQCAVAGSPTRSPSASPVIHLRRRKTLRMLLNRPDRHHGRIDSGAGEDDPPKKKTSTAAAAASKEARARRKLKDLFVASPPPIAQDRVSDRGSEVVEEEAQQREERGLALGLGFSPSSDVSVGFSIGFTMRRRGAGSLRPAAASGFRYRFWRRAWRPVLVSIPE